MFSKFVHKFKKCWRFEKKFVVPILFLFSKKKTTGIMHCTSYFCISDNNTCSYNHPGQRCRRPSRRLRSRAWLMPEEVHLRRRSARRSQPGTRRFRRRCRCGCYRDLQALRMGSGNRPRWIQIRELIHPLPRFLLRRRTRIGIGDSKILRNGEFVFRMIVSWGDGSTA